MTPYRHSVNYYSIPFLPTSLWLLKEPPIWGLHFPSCYIDGYWQLPRTVIIWHVLPLPQQATFLLITGREPISKNLLPSSRPFFSAGPAVWEELGQWEEAWPLPTSSLLWCTSSSCWPVGRNLRRLHRSTRNNDKGWQKGMLTRSLWGKICLNYIWLKFFILKSPFELRFSVSLATFIAFTNPDEKMRERETATLRESSPGC